ncbi:alpha/beta fold hydrolase [Sinosporangium siamense]|uniref:Oxidoreductase n=1 Tax=Sinosporangium siamense TaxID=1367973 RepID=A0A919VA13_9ACTN|nr:alpha/beta hydrolase [Sinosporangium siamense]GII95941.1 oxidoreductase [Sinosporangium siamense]
MGDYIAAGDARIWFEERGQGDPLVLMHGGFSDSRDFHGSLDRLSAHFRVYTPERRGHGHSPDVEGPFTGEIMAADMTAFLEKAVGGPAHLAGYSAGATVALHVARNRPDLVRSLVLISGAFHRDGWIIAPTEEGEMPQPVVDGYAEVSPDGRDHFPVIVSKIVAMAQGDPGLTEVDLAKVTARTLVMSGDDDIVHLEHSVALYRGLPAGELAIVPRTTHLLMFEKPELVTHLVTDFLTREPTPTFMPIRRAAQ